MAERSQSAVKVAVVEPGEFRIGVKIKMLRRERGVTLQTMAEEIGFSPALISQIENHNVSPPIATLAKIARYFDVPMANFFDEDEAQHGEYEIVRGSDRKRVRRVINPLGTDHGYTYEALCSSGGARSMEPFLLTVEPGVRDEESLYSHEGQEFLFVLEGTVLMLLGGDRVEMNAGDSLYFNSSLKHRMLNPGNQPSRVLAVITRGESKTRRRRKERADL
jgi:transcriptional regulator with XRE-family HTH domain